MYPAIVIYTNKLVPEGFSGVARGCVVCIRPEYREDTGLLAHERTHVSQWYRLTFLVLMLALITGLLGFGYWPLIAALSISAHALLYRFVSQYRLWCELQAYRVQARHYLDDRRPLFAELIATRYELAVSEEMALDLLRRGDR